VNAPVIAVVGPTAAGKSELAVNLALAVSGEVINVDSMQVYRGMDIGTAKLSTAEQRGVPHHLLDLWPVTYSVTVAEFQKLARACIADLHGRGIVPVLAGGSGLYVRGVLDDLEFPGTDPVLRARLEAELAETGPDPMYARLRAADPEAAERIQPNNGRRIVRALEVIEITGGPYVATLPEHRYVYPGAIQLGLDVPRPELDERIGRRVDRMFEAGFVDEVRGLLNKGLIEGKTANRALGYSQVIALLNGEIDEVEARERTAQATRRFARRQDSWFRKDQRISWLPYDDPDLLEKALEVIAEGNRKASSGVVGVEEGPSRHTGAVDARG
jgi:tRNA dimethylallyltransferase